MKNHVNGFGPREVQLLPSTFQHRFHLNRNYLLSLRTQCILQNHYLEAGIGDLRQLRNTAHGDPSNGDQWHWGWESPTSQVRGHFLGHWLSAAARVYATTDDMELKARVDRVVTALGRCQRKNGGEWVFSIPEKYFRWLAQGRSLWVPHYVVHKTLMGLFDAYKFAANDEALEILLSAANWFSNWSAQFSREQMDDILDVETGGMLESWVDLFSVTDADEHRALIERYTRDRFFRRLLAGEDVLTNMHANTTIPEIHGAARAYEVTGDERWRQIVEAYWKCAVTQRGTFCTGGQTSGEIWTPPFEFAARRGDKNQEHCTVYNMIRLAEFLFRWSGESRYADYIERNIYNGILAQQHPGTGMVAYYLPLEAGGQKLWGSPTNDFWCCHGTLVQAHSAHNAWIYYANGHSLVIAQYIPSHLTTTIDGNQVVVDMKYTCPSSGSADDNASVAGPKHRPNHLAMDIEIVCDVPTHMDLLVRIPAWVQEKPALVLNSEPQSIETKGSCFHRISRTWHRDRIQLGLPRQITVSPIPDERGTVAFLDGPVTLAGLCDAEVQLCGNKAHPDSILVPDNERQWRQWLAGYRTVGQHSSIRFKPLYEIVDEPYTVYFPVKPR